MKEKKVKKKKKVLVKIHHRLDCTLENRQSSVLQSQH